MMLLKIRYKVFKLLPGTTKPVFKKLTVSLSDLSFGTPRTGLALCISDARVRLSVSPLILPPTLRCGKSAANCLNPAARWVQGRTGSLVDQWSNCLSINTFGWSEDSVHSAATKVSEQELPWNDRLTHEFTSFWFQTRAGRVLLIRKSIVNRS